MGPLDKFRASSHNFFVTITNEQGASVLDARISGLVPGPAQREVLDRMLAEGEPTNALARSGPP